MKPRSKSRDTFLRRRPVRTTALFQARGARKADATGSQPTAKQIPSASYRLQFNREFTLRQAAGLAGYLRELGISHCYASPLFEARADSSHGYDVCRFDRINSNLGATRAFARFTSKLLRNQLGLVLDFVPNHMAADISNCWWRDVLTKGRASQFASFFDIDWERESSRGKILLPVLEDDYEKVLRGGKLRVVQENGSAFIGYYDQRFPLAPESLQLIRDQARQSPDELRALLAMQHYQLASWRDAATRINYRRFFDVSELVSLRMELPKVFEAAHGLAFRLIDEGNVNGLRIDHPDGLWNPRSYFARLRRKSPRPIYVVAEKILSREERLPTDWPVDGTTGYDFLNRVNELFVDRRNEAAFNKIYRQFAGVKAGFATVAYQSKKQILETSFGSEVRALVRSLHKIAMELGRNCAEPKLRAALVETVTCFPIYRTYVSEETVKVPADQVRFVEQALEEATRRNPRLNSTAMDLVRSVLLLRVPPSAIKTARHFVMRFQQLTAPVMAKGVEDTAFYRYHRFVSLNEVGGDPERFGIGVEEFHEHNRYMREHWPHSMLATATHDTKRGEDVRARLNVISEMPDVWRDAVKRWAAMNAAHKSLVRSSRHQPRPLVPPLFPRGGEDARRAGERELAGGVPAPDANDEYLLYQTLTGAWPDDGDSLEGMRQFRERISSYMLKAVREAKVHTSWTDPNPEYESAVTRFVERIFSDDAFLADFRSLQRTVAFFGTFNSLAQVLLKITSPGVPDFYQGTELWDLSLVDPDNRRPVDFEFRQRISKGLSNASPAELLANWRTGRVKMFVMQRALQFRRDNAALFRNGEYVPITAEGAAAQHVIAFGRRLEGKSVAIVVPRLVCSLMRSQERVPVGSDIWCDTAIRMPGRCELKNVITGEDVHVPKSGNGAAIWLRDALKSFPVALLAERDH